MVKVKVDAGICGFYSVISVSSEDMQHAKIEFKTGCPNLKPLETKLTDLDGFKECFSKISETTTYELANKYCKHPACPVPSAIIKGVEAACGLALPKNAVIEIIKE